MEEGRNFSKLIFPEFVHCRWKDETSQWTTHVAAFQFSFSDEGSIPSASTLRPDKIGTSRGRPLIIEKLMFFQISQRRVSCVVPIHRYEAWTIMFYVYILRSVNHHNQTYIGYSSDLKQRLQYHNSGKCKHTSKFIPWNIEFYCAFKVKSKALNFEKYLKSHSGKAFTNKRLI